MVGLRWAWKFWQKKPREIVVLFIYPNKDLSIFKVDATKKLWTNSDETDKTAYLIDETAIYFWKRKKPILIYRHGVASPIKFGEQGEVEYALKAAEVKALFESKAVSDLLTGGDQGINWTLIVAGAAALLSLINILIAYHVIKVPPAG